jgi:tetratricopeptide (TPR) repeat protein
MSDGITILTIPKTDYQVRTPVWKIAFLCGAAAITAPLAAQDPADHIAMGVAANEARDPATALQHFQTALRQDSMSYEANWRATMSLLTLTDLLTDSLRRVQRDSLYSLAERYAARAVASNFRGAEGHFALAAAVGTGAIILGPDARIRRAAIIRREALRAIQLDPKHDGAYHIMARWNAEIMRLSSISRFVARNFLGAGLFKQASWKKAIVYMEKAVQLDPTRIHHRLELARIYADQKRGADAEAQLHAVESLPAREATDSILKLQGVELRQKLAKR